MALTLLHSERPKLHRVLAVLSAIGLRCIKMSSQSYLKLPSIQELSVLILFAEKMSALALEKLLTFLAKNNKMLSCYCFCSGNFQSSRTENLVSLFFLSVCFLQGFLNYLDSFPVIFPSPNEQKKKKNKEDRSTVQCIFMFHH